MEEIKKLILDLIGLIKQEFAEIKNLLQSQLQSQGTVKKKRKLSAYQLFMKECIKKEAGTIPERFTKCVAKYREMKKSGRTL